MQKRLVLISILVLLSACAPPQPGPFVEGAPVEIIQDYYVAWAEKEYATMYTLVSDGWKALEPTARTETSFAHHMGGFYKEAKRIKLLSASEQSNDGSEAVVAVGLQVEALDGRLLFTNQTLTLKLKDNGWKLIHPYGEYKDIS